MGGIYSWWSIAYGERRNRMGERNGGPWGRGDLADEYGSGWDEDRV